jgi:hypothetical protein
MKLHEAGFSVALRWDNYSNDIGKFEQNLRDQYGPEAWYVGAPGFWKMHWGKSSYTMDPNGYSREYNRPYFIGFRNEADISVALLLL